MAGSIDMIRYFLSVCLLAGLGLAGCGQTPQPKPPKLERFTMPEDETIKIVILGDSLTAGYGLHKEQALPNVVERRLKSDGFDVEVYNSGISGDTTGGGYLRYESSVAVHRPHMLIIALATNDFLSGVPVEKARENLAAIVTRARTDGVFVVLVGIDPDFAGVPDKVQRDYSTMLTELAREKNISFHPGFMKDVWDDPDMLLLDGLHPNADGVERMAENLTGTLKLLIKLPE